MPNALPDGWTDGLLDEGSAPDPGDFGGGDPSAPTDAAPAVSPGPARDPGGKFIAQRDSVSRGTATEQADGASATPEPVPFQYRASRATQTFAGATTDPTTGAVTFSPDAVASLRVQLAAGHGQEANFAAMRQRADQQVASVRQEVTAAQTEGRAAEAVAQKAIDFLERVLTPEDFKTVRRELSLDYRDARGAVVPKPVQAPQNGQAAPSDGGQFAQAARGVLEDELETLLLSPGVAKDFPVGPARDALKQLAHQQWPIFVMPQPDGSRHLNVTALQQFVSDRAELARVRAGLDRATSAKAFNEGQNGTGAPAARRPAPARAPVAPAPATSAKPVPLKQQMAAFWEAQRAAVDSGDFFADV